MNKTLVRVGTIYLPVKDVEAAASWYVEKLGAELSYKDEGKAIMNLANMSFFLVKSDEKRTSFHDSRGEEQFFLTFEVDGLEALHAIHTDFKDKGIDVGAIEDRGHAGRNFVFIDLDGNQFDVWSELSPSFKSTMNL